jgi:hypothetical protein
MDALRYAQLVLERQDRIVPAVPPDSRTVQAIAKVRAEELAGTGCRGCRRRRLLRWLAAEIQQSTERTVVDSVVNVP